MVGAAMAVGAVAGTVSIAGANPTAAAASTKIRACVSDDGGAMRYVRSASKKCRSDEELVTWSEKGPKGLIGLTGEKGDTGEAGPAGPVGPAGPIGPPGTNGANGSDGATGPRGATGETGATGSPGASGSAGASGAAGKTVLSGTSTPTGGTVGDFYIRDPGTAPIFYGPRGATTWPTTGVALQGVAGTAGYERIIDPTPNAAVGTATLPASTATCSSGKVAVGGGYTTDNLASGDLVTGSYPMDSPQAWVAVADGAAATIQAYVICMTAEDD